MEKDALPAATATVASTVAPSVNCTVPVAAEFILALILTVCPATAGLGLTPAVIPAEALITCDSTAEVDAASDASPL